MFEANEVLQKLPDHLKSLIIEQPYNDYTAQDHAVWRYVMRQNIHYLKEIAHDSYLSGLEKTGISIDEIPHMYGMNRILQKIGWAAVAVDGFIPPSAFMEFQAYNVLVIAADIRPINQIGYTPAPDIIHEAAGHAPIIANPEYSEYLRLFGKYGCKAFSNPKDENLYLAIRHLSILKADPYTESKDIKNAEQKLDNLEKQMGEPSELSLLRNLHWWTVEYGLIGDLSNPKIYGAGLLSSISESKNALSKNVKILSYKADTKNKCFDITEMQPQLFVTQNFEKLTEILEDFVNQMALRTGGLSGIQKAIRSESIACCEYNSGLQISGVFTNLFSLNDTIIYLQTSGPTSLSYQNEELKGHGKSYHKDGFGSAVGKLKGINRKFNLLTDNELQNNGFTFNQNCEFEFESGIKIKGVLRKIIRKDAEIILMSFDECLVRYDHHILFEPQWGTYDLAIGEEITSVYNGPANPNNFEISFSVPSEKTHKIDHTEESKKLHKLYQKIRDLRTQNSHSEKLSSYWEVVKKEFPNEWLLILEIFELAEQKNSLFYKISTETQVYLSNLSKSSNDLKTLISDGENIIKKSVTV